MPGVEKKPKVKLTGRDGNAFAVIGWCLAAAAKAGWDREKVGRFRDEATGGGYDHLLRTCVKYFDVR